MENNSDAPPPYVDKTARQYVEEPINATAPMMPQPVYQRTFASVATPPEVIVITQQRIDADAFRMMQSSDPVTGVFCPRCEKEVETVVDCGCGTMAWVCCLFVSPLTLCCTLDSVHKCPECQVPLATHAACS